MSDEPVEITTAEDHSFGVNAVQLPPSMPVPFMVENGKVAIATCSHAANVGINILTFGEGEGTRIATVALAMSCGSDGLLGIFAGYDAAGLRNLAAECSRIADKLDGGRGKQ